MFGFSLAKLLVTAVIIAAVWYGFKRFGGIGQNRRDRVGAKRGASPARAEGASEDMVKCAQCGVYVSPAATSGCGRGDCPYPT